MNKFLKQKLLIGLLFFLISLVILFLNYYPHYYGLRKTPSGSFYSGQASWFDPWDINNYFAIIRRAQEKRSLLLENFNTSQPTKPTLIYPFYTIAGNLFPNINYIILFHVLTIVCGFLLILAIFYSSFLLLKNTAYSLVSLLFISLGGGFGWLFSSSGQSADIYIPGLTFLFPSKNPTKQSPPFFPFFLLFFIFWRSKRKTTF